MAFDCFAEVCRLLAMHACVAVTPANIVAGVMEAKLIGQIIQSSNNDQGIFEFEQRV